MTRQDIITRIQSGEKIKARINCYGKVYKRRLKVEAIPTFIDGTMIFCKVPRLDKFMVSMDEIISLHRV